VGEVNGSFLFFVPEFTTLLKERDCERIVSISLLVHLHCRISLLLTEIVPPKSSIVPCLRAKTEMVLPGTGLKESCTMGGYQIP